MLSRSSHAEADAAEQNYLRGAQLPPTSGAAVFASTFPAFYDGRWPHIHFEIFDSLESAVAGDNARLTSPDPPARGHLRAVYAADRRYGKSVQNLSQVTLNSDNVFGDGWDAELAIVTGDPNTAISVALTIGVADK